MQCEDVFDDVDKIGIVQEDLKQYAFDRTPVFAKFKKTKDGKVYIGATYSNLKDAILDKSPIDRRVNARNVLYIEKYASVDLGKNECAVLLTEEVSKKLSKLI
jgi:hypothetical protein